MSEDFNKRLKALKEIDVSTFSTTEAKEFALLLEQLEKREHQENSTKDFLGFVKSI